VIDMVVFPFTSILFLLLVWHALADYPLQGDFLAKAKNPIAPLPGVPWWQALLAHAFIHAGGTALVTGSLILGLYELVAHAVIDYAKCRDWVSFNMDQTLHVACKVVWTMLAVGLL
jgi:hypothetical protein